MKGPESGVPQWWSTRIIAFCTAHSATSFILVSILQLQTFPSLAQVNEQRGMCRKILRLKLISATNISRHQANVYANISVGGAAKSEKKTSICSRGKNSEWDLSFECAYTMEEKAVTKGNARLMIKLYRKPRWFSWPFRDKYMGKIDVKLVDLYTNAGGTGNPITRNDHLKKGKSQAKLEFMYEFIDFPKDGSAKWKKGLKFVVELVWQAVLAAVFAN